jgi:hypothetical protein
MRGHGFGTLCTGIGSPIDAVPAFVTPPGMRVARFRSSGEG